VTEVIKGWHQFSKREIAMTAEDEYVAEYRLFH
jgi:hypothetical protein